MNLSPEETTAVETELARGIHEIHLRRWTATPPTTDETPLRGVYVCRYCLTLWPCKFDRWAAGKARPPARKAETPPVPVSPGYPVNDCDE